MPAGISIASTKPPRAAAMNQQRKNALNALGGGGNTNLSLIGHKQSARRNMTG